MKVKAVTNRAMQLLLLALLPGRDAECGNACGGKGWCGAFDVCTCYKGWVGNDCSQRQCQFGLAHVDVPKGDLDGSRSITSPGQRVGVNSQAYRYGTSEQYPNMLDSDQNVLSNTGHEYVECSNKGYCDRGTGVCTCLRGYEGSACQFASCPHGCSGHGTCETARNLALIDAGNEYNLWDADVTLGCNCDAGYYGPDCSLRRCKVGYDPIYRDPDNNHRFSNWSYVLYSQQNASQIHGNYSLVFFDEQGESWKTKPISYGASCLAVTRALETLPNNAVPPGSVRCTHWSHYESIPQADEPLLGGPCVQYLTGCAKAIRIKPNTYFGIKYTLAFPLNPGILRPLQLDWYLDGRRPTLVTSEAVSTLGSFVYANGFLGEYKEYFTSKCLGVTVTITTIVETSANPTYGFLSSLTDLELRQLQMCLGDSDNNPTYSAAGSFEGVAYTWDYGSAQFPHLVRLVDLTAMPTTDLCDSPSATETAPNDLGGASGGRLSLTNGRVCPNPAPPGFIVPLYWDPSLLAFKLLTRAGEDYSPSTPFAIFTTTATASLVSDVVKIVTNPSAPYSTTVYSINATNTFAPYAGNLDCQTNMPGFNGAFGCLEKEDKVFFIDPRSTPNNPKYINIYTVKRVFNAHKHLSTFPSNARIVLDSAITSHWHNADSTVSGRVYKFVPKQNSNGLIPLDSYPYVAECSNRGICTSSGSLGVGECTCFKGYSGADCSLTLAINAAITI